MKEHKYGLPAKSPDLGISGLIIYFFICSKKKMYPDFNQYQLRGADLTNLKFPPLGG
jgi:hypothetical protein